jgi:RNA polymerase sigma-70 factor (ECF subfamily)
MKPSYLSIITELPTMEKNRSKFSLIADYYAAHYDELVAYVSKMIRYADGAEDIVQDVFLRLLRSDKLITPVTMPNLVYTVARNLIFDFWRHHRAVEEFEHYLVDGMRQGENASDVASVYNVTEIIELLERGMARLADQQREIYSMNVYGGMKVAEISDELRINYKSVEHRLGAARKEMRSFMKRMLAS